MFERLANGWELAKASLNVLKLDKELLLFPLISGISCLIVLASFGVPLYFSGYFEMIAEDQQGTEAILGYVVLFLFYLVNYFVIIFFNSALVACAVMRFKGHDPTLGDGLSAASRRIPQILGWAAVTATVGLILKIIESRSERVGEIVSGLLGMAWSITTYFVVPLIVVEKAGPVDAFKRSVSIMRQTWGEALGANFGIGFITFLFCLPGIGLAVAGIYFIGTGAGIVGGTLVGVGILVLLLVSLMSSTLDAILLAALYLYASEGTVPRYFDAGMLEHSFTRR